MYEWRSNDKQLLSGTRFWLQNLCFNIVRKASVNITNNYLLSVVVAAVRGNHILHIALACQLIQRVIVSFHREVTCVNIYKNVLNVTFPLKLQQYFGLHIHLAAFLKRLL